MNEILHIAAAEWPRQVRTWAAACTGSLAGGQTLEVSGSGFSDMKLDGIGTEVRICGVPCDVDTVVSSTSLTCTTGQYNTLDEAVEHHVLPLRTGQAVGSGSSHEQAFYSVNNLFDQDVSSSWRCAEATWDCFIS